MALSTLLPVKAPPTFTAQTILPSQFLRSSLVRQRLFLKSNSIPKFSRMLPVTSALTVERAVSEVMSLIQSSPATWKSALFSNLLIFVAGSPILITGLSLSGIGAAFLLGTLTWRAFGPSGFLLVATYFVLVKNKCLEPSISSLQKTQRGGLERLRLSRGKSYKSAEQCRHSCC